MPRWYFTSPTQASPRLPAAEACSPFSGCWNSPKILEYGLSITCARTFSRPRWAMPKVVTGVPTSAAERMILLSIGTTMSLPSTEKRFWPRKVLCKNFSKASTLVRRCSSRLASSPSIRLAKRPDSTDSRSQNLSTGS